VANEHELVDPPKDVEQSQRRKIMSDSFETILSDIDPAMGDLARGTKALISQIMPEVVEVVWENQRIAGYGVGPKKMSEQFCYIAVFKKHINLGFYYGADLNDPSGLLQGTGKSLRHIKISDPAQLQDPALVRLVEASSMHLPKLKS
jgi:hypothetical protein